MRRAEKEILDEDEMRKVLDDVRVCYLGVIDERGPYVVPMVFGHDRRSVFLHSALEGRKVRAIEGDPRVCLTFVADVEVVENGDPCGWTMAFRSVIIEGKARFLEERKSYALQRIFSQVAGMEAGVMSGSALVIEVIIEKMRGKRSGRFIPPCSN